ncbi:MAG: PqqD family protein [Clostridia bacterium]|nr:PqqD family protein [Clostridia bacterium]
MRIKSGYELKKREDRYIVTYNGTVSGELDNSIVLADTAVFLWNLLKEKDVTKTEMLNALIENFDISTVLALGNIDVFVRTMKENGIIE